MASQVPPTTLAYAGGPFESVNRELLALAAGMSDEQVVAELVPAHPQLLASYVLLHERDRIPEPARVLENRAFYVLAMLDHYRSFLEDQPESFLLGQGPIESIWTAATRRRISWAEATRRVTTAEFGWRLSPAYLRALCRQATRLVQDEVSRRDGWDLQELLLATAQGLPPVGDEGDLGRRISGDFAFMYEETAGDWLLTALSYLRAVPDGRIYRRAQVIADDLAERFRVKDEPRRVARALYRVASLGTDPFVGLVGGEQDVREALRRRFVGAQVDAAVDEPDWSLVDMPLLADALTLAERQFREAAALRVGHERGLALKAHVEVLLALRRLGRTVHDGDLLAVARAALGELDPAEDERHILSIRTGLRQAGLTFDAVVAEPQERTQAEISGPSSAEPHAAAFELGLQRAHTLGLEQPEQALRALLTLHQNAEKLGAGSRERLWGEELRQLAGLVRRGPAKAGRSSRRRPRSPLVALGASVDRAFALQHEERADEALALMAKTARAGRLGPEWQELDEALRYLVVSLSIGAAVNAVANDPAGSVARYVDALTEAGRLGLEGTVADLLRRIGWLARDSPSHEVAAAVCAGLLPSCRALTAATPQIRYEFHRACQLAFAAAMTSGTSTATADLLRQMIKGMPFAIAVRQRSGYTVAEDPQGRSLLAELADLDTPDATADTDADSRLFAEDALLTTYVNSREVRPGASPAERIANIQRAFDERLFERLLRNEADYALFPPEDVRRRLDQRTALADVLLGLDADQQLAIYTWLHTSDGVQMLAVRSGDLPGLADWMGDDQEVLVHPLAEHVRAIRELLQDYPGPGRQLCPEAEDALLSMARRVMGGADGAQVFFDLAASGRDRLIVVPHGPLHFLPFHLLPVRDRLLADLFTVTVLPNRELLARRSAAAAPRERSGTRPATALGLSFADGAPAGLPPLPDSVREAREVAVAFGTRPLLDSDATVAAFLHALEHSRYVHLSTHGRNTTAGAAFQLLYLWPHDGADGRLRAYELLDLDLSGLDVLSLSACETALGRFDLFDNLRGLPASFLLRGVRTLIGTLWDAEVTASRTFFTSFYQHALHDAPGDVAAAFRSAQATTRAAHPEYRDWGAFYLMGEI